MTSYAQRIGNLGEKALQYLCAEHSIIATRTDEDRLGWDYFLEIPSSASKPRSPDKPCATLRCLVQIKATTSHSLRVKVRADAMKPLVDADLPAFILLFEFERNKLRRAYAQHVDDRLIERTLKRLRHRYAISKTNQKHGELTISFGSANQILTTGEALAERLWSCVPDELSRYLERKKRQRTWLGYESIPMNISIRSDRSPIVELIEHDLGIVDHLSVPRLTLRDRRFGLEVEEPLAEFSEGRLEMRAHKPLLNDAAAFAFATDPEDMSLIFPAEHRASHFNNWAPLKDQRFRLSGGWFDILVCPFSDSHQVRVDHHKETFSGSGSVRIVQNIEPEKNYKTDFLLRLVRASHQLATSDLLHFTIWLDSDSTCPMKSKLRGLKGTPGLPSMEYELHLLEALNNILRESEIDSSTLSICLNSLAAQAEELSFIEAISNGSLGGAKIHSRFVPRNPENQRAERRLDDGVWITIGQLKFRERALVVVASLMLEQVEISSVSECLTARVTETQLLIVTPLMQQTLPTRFLGKQIQHHLASLSPNYVISEFRTSAEALRTDGDDFEKSFLAPTLQRGSESVRRTSVGADSVR